MKLKLTAFLICLLLLLQTPLTVSAESETLAEGVIEQIINFEKNNAGADNIQSWLDNELKNSVESGSEWFVFGLSRYIAGLDFSGYKKAVSDYIDSGKNMNAVTRQKYALIFISSGYRDEQFIYDTLENTIGKLGIMSYVYGLQLINNGYTSGEYSKEVLIEKLLSLQLEDGGWAVTGKNADADVTAMTLQALAPSKNDERVSEAIDAALSALSKSQNDDGSFSNYGVANAESTAQVIIALSELGIDSKSDERFKKDKTAFEALLGFMLDNGGFCHVNGEGYNLTATAQAFCAFTAYFRYENGSAAFWQLDSEDGVSLPSENSASEQSTEEELQSEASVNASKNDAPEGKSSVKIWISVVIAAFGASLCIVMLLRKNRKLGNYLTVVLICAAAICAVTLVNIQTPDEYYSDTSLTSEIGTATLTIRCDAIAGRAEGELPDKIILEESEYTLYEGDTVYTFLERAIKTHRLQMEISGSATGSIKTVYVKGINNIYEFDYGELSGWIYRVNGKTSGTGCGNYRLENGDEVEWLYTCELGNDLEKFYD